MAAVVMLPLVVDLASRAAGMDPTLAEGRTRMALAVTGASHRRRDRTTQVG